jgi:hypothetical protein
VVENGVAEAVDDSPTVLGPRLMLGVVTASMLVIMSPKRLGTTSRYSASETTFRGGLLRF